MRHRNDPVTKSLGVLAKAQRAAGHTDQQPFSKQGTSLCLAFEVELQLAHPMHERHPVRIMRADAAHFVRQRWGKQFDAQVEMQKGALEVQKLQLEIERQREQMAFEREKWAFEMRRMEIQGALAREAAAFKMNEMQSAPAAGNA